MNKLIVILYSVLSTITVEGLMLYAYLKLNLGLSFLIYIIIFPTILVAVLVGKYVME